MGSVVLACGVLVGVGMVLGEPLQGMEVEVRRAVRLTVQLGDAASAGTEEVVRRARVVEGRGGAVGEAGGGEGEVSPEEIQEASEERVSEERTSSRMLWSGDDEELEGTGADGSVVSVVDAARSDLRSEKRLVVSLEAGVLYDDNIFLRGVDPVADTLWRASGEARMNFGDVVRKDDSYLVVGYRPDAYFFQENTDENTVDHEATIGLRRKLAKLAVDATGKYQRTSGSTVDLGDRVPRDVVVARAGVVHEITAKARVATAVRWESTSFLEGGYSDSREWAHESFGDYQVTEKFQLGLGGTYGRLDVDDGSEPQDFQRATMRLRYAATGKLQVTGRVGAEFRQTEVGDTTTPVFGVDATHEVTGKTALRLQAVQEVAASGSLEGQNYVRTGVGGGLSHRVSDRVSVSLDGGWERYEYEAATIAAAGLADRTDHGVYLRPGFTYTFGDRWKAEAWYQWRSSDSTDPTQEYDANQAGINLRREF